MGLSTVPARLPERLTIGEAAATLSRLQQELGAQRDPVVAVDAEPLKVFDTSAVAVLLELRRGLNLKGQSLQLLNQSKRLSDFVALYGVAELLAA